MQDLIKPPFKDNFHLSMSKPKEGQLLFYGKRKSGGLDDDEDNDAFFSRGCCSSLTDKCDHFTLIPKWFTYGVNVPTLLPSKSAPPPTAGQIIILTKLIGCWLLLEGFLIYSTASKASMFDAESISDRAVGKMVLR